jgi:hypothetical protein
MHDKNRKEADKEQMLKETVLTFASEALSSDLKFLIEKNTELLTGALKSACDLLGTMIESESADLRKKVLDKKHPANRLLEYCTSEIMTLNESTYGILESALEEILSYKEQLKERKMR